LANCFVGIAFFLLGTAVARAQTQIDTALVRHAPAINSATVIGSLQQMSGENVSLNGNASISGDLLVPGTPKATLNGHPNFGGTIAGAGSAAPSSYTVTLNGNCSLGHLRTRTDPVILPTVSAPPQPAGTRDVALNSPGQDVGNFSTLRNLTLNGNVGQAAIPPGTYGTFTANSNSGFTLGVAGATQPAIYNLQGLTLNSSSQLQIVGPVVLTLAGSLTLNSTAGTSTHPEWLTLNVASGSVTLNGNVILYGLVAAPASAVTLNGNSQLIGGLISDRLTMNGNSFLRLQVTTQLPPVITSSLTVTGQVGAAFSCQVTATNSPTSYNATGLPPGLSVDTSTGLITGTPTTAGTNHITISASNSGGTGSATLVLTVNPEPVTFDVSPVSFTYNGSEQGPTITPSISGVTFSISGTASATSAGSYTVTATATGNYSGTSGPIGWTIAKATSVVSWATPAPIVYGMPLGSTQLNATANVPGAFIYTPPAGTVFGVGLQTLTVLFTPADITNYTNASASVSLPVNAEPVTFTVSPVSFTYNGSVQGPTITPSISGATYSISGTASATSAGSYTVTATATGNYSGTSGPIDWTIAKATPVVSWATPAPITYGTALGATQLNATANVPGTFAYNPDIGTVLDVGTQTLSVLFTPADAADYIATSASVPLQVNAETVTFTVSPGSFTYNGSAQGPTITPSISGATYTTSGTASATAAGSYTVTATATGNYSGTSGPTTWTIAQATPVVSWPTPATITYGTVLDSTQLNATADVPGAFIYAPAAGTVPNAGTQTLSVAFTPTDTTDYSNASAAVSLQVNLPPTVSLMAPASGALFVAPASITLTAAANSSSGTISKVEFYQGTTLLGTATTAPYQFNWPSVAAGNYSLTAKAYDNLNASTVSQVVNIIVDAPPTVSLTTPASNDVFVAPATVSLVATANSSGGTISKVDFYQGATLLGTATTAPYQFNWTNVSAGNYALTAIATDNLGVATTSSVVNIVSDTPPTVSLTAPANKTILVAPATVSLAATANASAGTISKVEFYQGTTLLGTATTAPYQFNWASVAAGNYTLTAKAYDNYNVGTVSSSVAIIVDEAPTVSLTAPANHAVFAAPAAIMLAAKANSSGGTISKVDFYQGATLLGTATTAPYQFNWTNIAAGAYSLTAVATDNLGVSTTSSAVAIIADTPPTVTLTAPTDKAVIAPSAAVTLTATASASNNGTISKVDFYQGTTLLGTAAAPVAGQPGSYLLTLSSGLSTGQYTLTAIVTDSLGIAMTSPPTAITVDIPPTVSLTSPPADATFVMPSPIVLTATASASAGETVSTVEFFYGSTSLGLGEPVSGQPGTYLLTLSSGLSPGSYALNVVATDNLNVSTTSSPVSIFVILDQPPTITPDNPSPTFGSSDNVSVSFDASDAVGPVSKVEIYRDGILDSTLASPTSGSTWSFTEGSNLPPGTYTYVGVAYDNYGGKTPSSPVTVTVLASMPYLTDFEASEGYNLGSLNHQLGWSVNQGSASVANLGVGAAHGSQSVVLQPGAPAQIMQTFAPLAGKNIIFVDFYAKPVAEADVTTATTFNIGSARFAFVLNGGQGMLEAFNGNGSGGGTWSPTKFIASLTAGNQSQNWIHLTARLDFTQGTWDLYAGGAMVAANQGFLDSTSTMLTSFSVQGDAATASEIDDILAGTNNPLFADVNNDGIDDAWEQKYGLNLSTNDRNLDPTGNGQTVLYDYINGLDPTDYYSGVLPVLTSLVDPSGVPGAQGLVSVKVTRASDGSVLANAPVAFAVTMGASQVSATAGGTGSTQVKVLTNASGIAQAYINFTSFAADVLVATAQSGSQTTSLSIDIYPTDPNVQGPLNLMAGGDAVLWQDASNVTRLWGRNNQGQLGDGTVIGRSQMRRISGVTQPLISAALGEGHGLAVTHSGQVYTWGDNYFGQLGDGTQVSHHTAVILTGLTGITQVAAGDEHSLALRSDGTVWAWGGNQSGQLGDGTKVNRSAPVQVPGLANIIQVVAGARHSAALAKDGTIWVWGSNEFGQLGGGAAIADSSTPIALAGLSQVLELVSGRQFLLALKADGTVWAWGDNHAGQLGVGTTTTVTLPQLNPTLSGIKALAAGNNHAVALDDSGTVWVWGANDSGQLGNGTNTASATPVALGLTGVQAVAAGYDHVVVVKADGTLWAWGLNTFGQLGNSTASAFSNVPIAVAPPND
jgi:alpha-tubulin suppressor-like RCC1 family protein